MTNLDTLRPTQPGGVLTRHDPAFAEATRWPGPRVAPDVLVQPESAQEVGAALRWAAAEAVDVAVRSGGHGAWASVPGGLLVDLSALAHIDIADGGVVSVGPGATWGAVADALAPHGLALSSGDTRSVGVGGNALGAGVGWLVRSVGLAVDQLVGAEIVTADGRVVAASPDENPDLFFGIRGGGGNFGVATRLDFRAAPLDRVLFGTAPVEAGDLVAVIRGVRDAMRAAPRQLGVTVVHPPPMGPALPPMVEMLWAGDDEDAARDAVAPLLALDGVGAADLALMPYAATLAESPVPPGQPPRMTSSNGVFSALADATIELAAATLASNPASLFEVRFLGGALGDAPPDATPLTWRNAEALLHWISFLPPDATDGAVAQAAAAWAPVGDRADAICGTFTDHTDPRLVDRMYPPATLQQLRALKTVWDPGNLFRRNHNILPG
ncbi:MAG TPA: FAD-binding oxidoreductase [Lapillicoccus sp.]|nr:FAD-binding oxidoreductase [Lapillicoccus sp.]